MVELGDGRLNINPVNRCCEVRSRSNPKKKICVPWSTRPLLPAPARDDLCLAQYQGSTQVIHIEEEIPEPVIVARLNYHQAEPAPYIGLFLEGRRVLLDPEVRRIPELDGGWYLVINERQDYETEEMQQYAFRVHVDSETVVPIVVVSVVNIDDNQPFVNVFDACQVAVRSQLNSKRLILDIASDLTPTYYLRTKL
ncbi:hypothetical protein EVAR_48930_1 [Eumeta japonica]|uniref:Uncharacterized protein n=1 Tax=Eumeta variegata TaxID=151549 RepID=A0A4C1YT53_EUMVA|nr:hypothetical protein EVAR_48930_1 [Eumeta japonica]